MKPKPPLKAPFPWFGGKSRVAHIVWPRLGNVRNYIEPFAGSLAMLLQRPHEPHVETVNDLDCYLANFWRAVQSAPDAVAEYADWPVNEADLHARHKWLVEQLATGFAERVQNDPDYYDAKIAGWWVWGICAWIGSGWCTPRPAEKRPNIATTGRGVHRIMLSKQCPHLGNPGQGVHRPTIQGNLVEWFAALQARLRRVRVCCGDWKRVCSSKSTTTRLGLTGVFLDPPYSGDAGRDNNIYREENLTVADECREWCLEYGDNPKIRIALCGYEGEHNELESHGWDVVAWKAPGGYASQGKRDAMNRHRERIWFSPHCEKITFFGGE